MLLKSSFMEKIQKNTLLSNIGQSLSLQDNIQKKIQDLTLELIKTNSDTEILFIKQEIENLERDLEDLKKSQINDLKYLK